MKAIKLSLVALAAFFVMGANAQVGLQAGYSNSKETGNGLSLNGFHVGPAAEITVQGPISLQYALLYNYLTRTDEASILGQTVKTTTTAHMLDLPVRIAANFPTNNGLGVFIFAGPNFNYALSQKTKASTSGILEGSYDTDNIYTLEMTNGKKMYSPFDLQLGVGGGIKYKSISLSASYDWGMLDRDNTDNGVWKNNDLKISLGYNF
ncbi:MAG: hypothetical protein H6Q19_388 [Bacteroidetes bacterium]|nr:hypothetical protein [Bacteroidota bacterium]